MPSNGLEFYYELDKQGHGNSWEWISEMEGQIIGCPTLYQRMIHLCLINTSFETVEMKQNLTNALARQVKMGLKTQSSLHGLTGLLP